MNSRNKGKRGELEWAHYLTYELSTRSWVSSSRLMRMRMFRAGYPRSLDVINAWLADYGAANGGVTPDAMNLKGQDFDERVGRVWGAHRAASNAACYAGGRGGRPAYAAVYDAVWVEQKWPELCKALEES